MMGGTWHVGRCVNGWLDGQKEGWMDRWMGRLVDG